MFGAVIPAEAGISPSGITMAAFYAADYYPYVMVMPGREAKSESYRYGFQGMERDVDFARGNGNSYTTEFRQYDARLGRWLTLDPLKHIYPGESPYSAFGNNPVYYIDPLGLVKDGKYKNENDQEVYVKDDHYTDKDGNILEDTKDIEVTNELLESLDYAYSGDAGWEPDQSVLMDIDDAINSAMVSFAWGVNDGLHYIGDPMDDWMRQFKTGGLVQKMTGKIGNLEVTVTERVYDYGGDNLYSQMEISFKGNISTDQLKEELKKYFDASGNPLKLAKGGIKFESYTAFYLSEKKGNQTTETQWSIRYSETYTVQLSWWKTTYDWTNNEFSTGFSTDAGFKANKKWVTGATIKFPEQVLYSK